jgi:hypothetical protein
LWFEASLGKNQEDFISNTSQVWWYMPVITAKQEVEVGGSQGEPSLGKGSKLYLKNKLKVKGLEVWLKW